MRSFHARHAKNNTFLDIFPTDYICAFHLVFTINRVYLPNSYRLIFVTVSVLGKKKLVFEDISKINTENHLFTACWSVVQPNWLIPIKLGVAQLQKYGEPLLLMFGLLKGQLCLVIFTYTILLVF
jgi:hypothetical protein